MKSLSKLSICLLSFALFGCANPSLSPATPMPSQIVNIENHSFTDPKIAIKSKIPRTQQCRATPSDIVACQAVGGEMVESGMAGCERCIVQFADAGKTCQDSSECLGDCFAVDVHLVQPPTGKTNLKGQCSASNSPFGCRARLENGKSLGVLCVD